jgi:hypothetical protein
MLVTLPQMELPIERADVDAIKSYLLGEDDGEEEETDPG